jgi:hypothetical protein
MHSTRGWWRSSVVRPTYHAHVLGFLDVCRLGSRERVGFWDKRSQRWVFSRIDNLALNGPALISGLFLIGTAGCIALGGERHIAMFELDEAVNQTLLKWVNTLDPSGETGKAHNGNETKDNGQVTFTDLCVAFVDSGIVLSFNESHLGSPIRMSCTVVVAILLCIQ